MKRILLAAFAAILALSSQSAHAQSQLPADDGMVPSAGPAPAAGSTTKTAAPAPKPVFVSSESRINYVSMSSRDNKAIFSGLDGLGDLKAIVTNGDGRTLCSTTVNSRQNAVNITHLKAGLYYITLINENSGRRRAFVLNR